MGRKLFGKVQESYYRKRTTIRLDNATKLANHHKQLKNGSCRCSREKGSSKSKKFNQLQHQLEIQVDKEKDGEY